MHRIFMIRKLPSDDTVCPARKRSGLLRDMGVESLFVGKAGKLER
jgi:hypothetical protein